ncbi:hypothetical protein HUS23_13525 [Ectothiorhodospiraceae bacterium 2226]|nr:hypothetical protein HUS23_13525 [Ectothiorhodospiraceae bacterium 2226]
METGSSSTDALCQGLTAAAAEVANAYRQAPTAEQAEVVTPELLAEAIDQFVQIVARLESDFAAARTSVSSEPEDMTQLIGYGLDLLNDLGQWAAQLNLTSTRPRIDALAVPLALWGVRRGGRLNNLEPVVNALAVAANATQEPRQLAQLVPVMGEIAAGAAEEIRQDLDQSNPARPWRILHLNRAIVATRANDPALMRKAFDDLIQALPTDAPGFFEEGMRQMEALDYPAPVREVMSEYHRRFQDGGALH